MATAVVLPNFVTTDAAGNATFNNLNVVGLGAKDASNYTAGTYYETDWLGEAKNTQTFAGTGVTLFGIQTPGGVPTVPAGFAASDIDQRTGIGYVSTQASNDYAAMRIGDAYFAVYPNSPATTLTMWFCTPTALSTAADRYSINYGFFFEANGVTPQHGWALTYSDNVNSGNWVFNECVSNVATAIANTSIAPVAKQWMKVTIMVANKRLTVTVTPSGGSATVIVNNVLSPQLNAGNGMPLSCGSVQMKRTTFTAGAVGAAVDYSSIYTVGTTRT